MRWGDVFREDRTLRTILDEYFEKVEKLQAARAVLHGEEPASDEAVKEAVFDIWMQIPGLLAAPQSLLRVLEKLEDEADAATKLRRSGPAARAGTAAASRSP